MQNRKQYMDGVKGIAILLVYTTHFIADWNYDYFRFWDNFFIKGLSGKLGVAFFCVVLGYFARKSKKDLEESIIKRYLYFFSCGLLINLMYVCAGRLNWMPEHFSLPTALYQGAVLGSEIFPTFWCIPAFLIASVISYFNGKVNAGMKTVILEMLLLCFMPGTLWVIICLLGNIVYEACDRPEQLYCPILRNRFWVLGITVLSWIFINREESTLTYLLDGLFGMMLLVSLHNSPRLQKVFGIRWLAFLGRYSMSIFLVHVLVYTILGRVLFDIIQFPRYAVEFLTVWGLCLGFCCAIAVPFDLLAKRISDKLSSMVIALYSK